MKKPGRTQLSIATVLVLAATLCADSVFATLTVSTANEHGTASTYPFTPTWTPATNSLIAGLLPSYESGNFELDNSNRNVANLTSGGSLAINSVPGNAGPDPIGNGTTSSNYVTCGNGAG